MSLTAYKTLMRRAEDEFVINKSRFIGAGCPCETEDEALAFLKSRRETHKDANHNCYAYVIGPNMGIMRYSDDGEPGGTAGLPIISAMKAQGVTNACLVVTRYFGGVLLGAGGLTRAYAQGAGAALSACRVGTMHPSARYLIDVPYPMLGRMERLLKDQPVAVEDKSFGESILLTLLVRTRDEGALAAAIVDASEGRIEPLRVEEMHWAWVDETDAI